MSAADDKNMRKKLSRAIEILSEGESAPARLFHSRADDDRFSYDYPLICDVSENLAPSHSSQVFHDRTLFFGNLCF